MLSNLSDEIHLKAKLDKKLEGAVKKKNVGLKWRKELDINGSK